MKKCIYKFVSLFPNKEQPPYFTTLTLIPFTNIAFIKCQEEPSLKKFRSQIAGLSYKYYSFIITLSKELKIMKGGTDLNPALALASDIIKKSKRKAAKKFVVIFTYGDVNSLHSPKNTLNKLKVFYH